MSKARFQVQAKLEHASLYQTAHVYIDHDTNVLTVRPFRGQREYTMPLADIASWVVRKTIMAETRK